MDNLGFYTPQQLRRVPVNIDAYCAAQQCEIKPGDIIETAQGVVFEVERANGYVISGHTANLRLTEIDLRQDKATIIRTCEWAFQQPLFEC